MRQFQFTERLIIIYKKNIFNDWSEETNKIINKYEIFTCV